MEGREGVGMWEEEWVWGKRFETEGEDVGGRER